MAKAKNAFMERIETTATEMREESSESLERMEKQYWTLHNEIAATPMSRWEQHDAIARLSQFGMALYSAGKAYSAINKAHCNLP